MRFREIIQSSVIAESNSTKEPTHVPILNAPLEEANARKSYHLWNDIEGQGKVTNYKGKTLSIRDSGGQMIGSIDGQQITRAPSTYGNWAKMVSALYDEVDGETTGGSVDGMNIRQMIAHLKRTFSVSRANGWQFYSADTGDFRGKNKSKAFGIEFVKTIDATEKDTGKKWSRSHKFIIQAYFSTDPNSDSPSKVIIWLKQGGMITFGAPQFAFKHGDFDSFVDALKQALSTPDSEIIKPLYKSGYDSYGRE